MVRNLTGYTWIANQHFVPSSDKFIGTFNIIFESNGATYSSLKAKLCYDLNDDGQVNSNDTAYLSQVVSKVYPADVETMDLNMDGKITNADVIILFNYISQYNPDRDDMLLYYEDTIVYNARPGLDGVARTDWKENYYKEIHIIGGADATNSELIAWMYRNGTLVKNETHGPIPKPILFSPETTDFTTYGIGVLSDCIKGNAVEGGNDENEITIEYPITGRYYHDIKQRSIILAKPSVLQDPQPYRVYEISKVMNGVVTIYAAHISYDLKYAVAMPFNAGSCALAMQQLQLYANNGVEGPWTFWTDKDVDSQMSIKKPATVRSLLGGVEGSILDLYGGEYKWDGYNVELYTHRGTERGVQIRYGKNLTDATQEENCSNLYTEVLCYFYKESEEGDLLDIFVHTTVTVTQVYPERTYNYKRTLILDASSDFDEEIPTEAMLKERAKKYIRDNDVGVPDVSLKVSFEMLGQSEQYKDYHLLENVELFDKVTIIFEKLGINASAKVVRTDYDFLLGRYNSIELGNAKQTLSNTIARQQQEIDKESEINYNYISRIVDRTTALITGNNGGYIVLHDTNNDRRPDEILVMNTESILTATKVWRWNKSGLGYSESGYNGPYRTAITSNGEIVGDFIKAGEIDGNLVKAGSIQAGQLSSAYVNSVLQQIDRVALDADDALNEYKDTISNYMTFGGADGLIIGGNNGFQIQLVVREEHAELNFIVNNTRVAYMTDEMLYIDKGEVKTSLKIGVYEWRPRPVTVTEEGETVTKRNLSLIYVGGDE